MGFTRKIWIAIFCGVPIVVGGGLVYALFDYDLKAVAIYETILLFVLGGFVKPS